MIHVEINGLEEAKKLLAQLGSETPRAAEKAVMDAGFAASRSLVRCYRARGAGGRHVSDTVTNPKLVQPGPDAVAEVGIGHKWAELFETKITTIPVIPRRASDYGLRGFPMKKKKEGGKTVFRATIGIPAKSYVIVGANCIPGALEEGKDRIVKSLRESVSKLAG